MSVAVIESGRPVPWRRLPAYDVSIPRALAHLFATLKTWHETEVRAAMRLQYLYERDRFRTRSGFQMPSWVLQEYGWLQGEQNYAQPTRNVIKSRVDAVTSLLFSSGAEPRLEIYAAGAGYEEQVVAKSRSAALDGTMNSAIPRAQRKLVARTGLICSFAACMPVARNNRVDYHAIDTDRLYWDPHDARNAAKGDQPREMHMVEFIDRAELIAWYKGLDVDRLKLRRKAANMATLAKMYAAPRTRETSVQGPYEWQLDNQGITDATDRIRVVHSYRVATSPLSEDGRYVCTAWDGASESHGIVLVDRPFGRVTLPVVWWSPYPPECGGLVGAGLASQLVEVQRAIDYAMNRTQQRSEKMGWAKVLMSSNTPQTVEDNLRAEEIATIKIPGMDGPPIVMPLSALSEHDIAWIQMLFDWSGGDQGINDAIARGGSNRGATASGIAMFEELDRQIDRISDIYEAWQQFSLRLGNETIGAIEDACLYDSAFASHYKGPDGMPLEYDWADKSLPTAQYVLEIEQAGEFGRTRAGRIARLQEGARIGIFDPADVAAALRSDPDVRRLSAQSNALRTKIESDLDRLVDPRAKHDQVIVTRDDDLPLAARLATERIADARSRGAKDETVLRLREYRRQAEAELDLLLAEQQPPAPMDQAIGLSPSVLLDPAAAPVV